MTTATIDHVLRLAQQLPQREQVRLIALIADGLTADLPVLPPEGSAERLLGIIPTPKELNDEDIVQIRHEHLMEKYS